MLSEEKSMMQLMKKVNLVVFSSSFRQNRHKQVSLFHMLCNVFVIREKISYFLVMIVPHTFAIFKRSIF